MKPAGYIKLPTTLGYDLRYTREVRNADGSRRIIVGTNRSIASEINRIPTKLPSRSSAGVNKANVSKGGSRP